MATGCVSRDLVPSYDSCNELLFLLWDNYLLYTLTWCKCLERHPLSNKTRVGNELYFTSHRASVVKTLDLLKKGTKQNRLCFFYFFILLFNYVKASGSSIFPRRASLLLYSSFLIEMHPAWQMLGWTGQSLRETTGTPVTQEEWGRKEIKKSTTLPPVLAAVHLRWHVYFYVHFLSG